MAVYNGQAYLRETVESILNQTLRDFEFVIIDDGSTDESAEILFSYDDDRIVYERNRSTCGQGNALNRGIALSRGQYIALTDCDDVSLPRRLEKQVKFMEKRTEIGICGTWMKTIGEKAGEIWRPPAEHAVIAATMLLENSLSHSSLMLRRETIEREHLFYDPLYRRVHDYELWTRAALVTVLANIQEVLVLYRNHSGQQSLQGQYERRLFLGSILLNQLSGLGIFPEEEEFELHQLLCNAIPTLESPFINKTEAWLKKLDAANHEVGIYRPKALSHVLACKWYHICFATPNRSLRKLLKSSLFQQISVIGRLSYIVKWILISLAGDETIKKIRRAAFFRFFSK